MPFNDIEKNRIINIINQALSRSNEFNNEHANINDLGLQADLWQGLINFEDPNNNVITRIFNNTCINRYNSNNLYYHFKPINSIQRLTRVLNIIDNRQIQVSNLLANEQNDFAEYSKLYKRLGLFNKFIPHDYCNQNQNGVYNPASASPVDNERNNIFILCFSRDYQNLRFWNEYAADSNGVCFVFRFTNFVDLYLNCYDLRDVVYDDGYRFDFINEINYFLRQAFRRLLFLGGITKFSRFYKRFRYFWEVETRLSFDYNSTYQPFLSNNFPLVHDANRTFIELPLTGNTVSQKPLFNLTIEEIICGNNVSQADYDIIENSLRNNFSAARISRFNIPTSNMY